MAAILKQSGITQVEDAAFRMWYRAVGGSMRRLMASIDLVVTRHAGKTVTSKTVAGLAEHLWGLALDGRAEIAGADMRTVCGRRSKKQEGSSRPPPSFAVGSAALGKPGVIGGTSSKPSSDGLPRIPVALVIRGYKGKQRFAVTAADLRSIVANFRKRQTGAVLIDYDHSTLNVEDGRPKPAAGWLTKIDDAPDAKGVLWGYAEYTRRAAAMVAAEEYKYVSPVIEWAARDKRTGKPQGATLTSLALTNRPLFEALPSLPLAASDGRGPAVKHGRRQADRFRVTGGKEKQ